MPSYYCGCAACVEARTDTRAARSCACLLVSATDTSAPLPTQTRHTLIDAGPELRTQLVRAEASAIDRLLVTHEHFDHIGGIPQLEFYVKLKSLVPLPVYAGSEASAAIRQQFSFMLDTLDLRPLDLWQRLEFDGIAYTPLPAQHAPGTFGFLIESPKTRLAYFPDTGPLPQEALAALAVEPLDILVIDATFNGRNWMPRSHHSISDAIALAERLAPAKAYLTHLSMHYDEPITCVGLSELLAPYGGAIEPAYDGLRVAL
ncbi:MAG: MBL fold metallo-hydrolase [Coriobacteriales bacterium]|nr:MBL fold metallo-hydrolase [Coriobacteriales bacterium]